jgi:RNA polymerase sigma-70 factor (ECF subfamily)
MKLPHAAAAPARPSRAQPADPELMRALAAGDLGALGMLYDRYGDNVRQFLRRASSNQADVDDLLHETFLFLIGIAAQMLRRRHRFLFRWSEILHELEGMTTPRVSTPEELAAHTEDLDAVDAALTRMSEKKRLVYLMVEREGMSGEDVAAALGVPIGTVWTRLHHARAALEQALVRRAKR